MAPLPSRSEHKAPATLRQECAQTLAEFDLRAGLTALRPAVLVIFTALRTKNDALAFLSVWRT